ncbi:MAG: hypothetical protein JWO42_4080, partial [Chloroflexi bacterium]|nr:hypothetical protein [Chloroflexota bacterium]
AARTGQRIGFGDGTVVDVLLPTSLSLDAVPAPVAYRLRIGRLAVLVLNREALSADLASLRADGACFDTVVLPARADPTAASTLVHALHPRLIILPQAQRPAAPLVAAQLGALPAGTNVWTAAEGAQRVLDARDGRCP